MNSILTNFFQESFSPVTLPAQDEVSVSRRQRQGQGQSQRLRQVPSERIVSSIKGETKQSKRIPYWMWIGIAKTLGIRRNPKEKPVLAWVLHLATITSATGDRGFKDCKPFGLWNNTVLNLSVMGFTRIWFSGYDIASLHTQSDVLDGTVSAIMIALFVGLGTTLLRETPHHSCNKTICFQLAFQGSTLTDWPIDCLSIPRSSR